MFGSVVLDVAVGMAFVYLLLSLIASVLQEMLATFMQLRPANLLRGLRSLFSGDAIWGKDLVDSIYTHGLVRGLFADPVMDLKARQPMDPAEKRNMVAAPPAQPVQPAANANLGTQPETSLAKPLDPLRLWLRNVIGIKPEKDVRGVTNQLLLPAYIPPRTFALALIDTLNSNNAMGQEMMKSITQSLADHNWIYKGNKAGQALYALAMDARGDIDAFQKNLENWYNDSMDRASGWYKRYTQRVLLVIGLVLAVMFNVSSVRVAQTLWFDRDARQAMASAAEEYVKVHPNPAAMKDDVHAQSSDADSANSSPPQAEGNKDADKQASKSGDLEKKLKESADAFDTVTSSALLPVGWKHSLPEYWNSIWYTLGHFCWSHEWWDPLMDRFWHAIAVLVGWFLTAAAISLGAPFWFDMLNKIMVVRGTIKPREKSETEGSKDRSD